MITHTFEVKDEERMNIVKIFIRQNMPTARFNSNPYKYSNGRWGFNISYEIEDQNKISVILNNFDLEDNPPVIKKKIFWKRILKYF